MFKYKKENSLEKRIETFNKLKEKHPKEIPIICEKAKDSKIGKDIKSHYLFKEEYKFVYFMKLIRKKLELNEDEGLFFFINGKYNITGEESMKKVYEKYKDKDGFLYIIFGEEKIFG